MFFSKKRAAAAKAAREEQYNAITDKLITAFEAAKAAGDEKLAAFGPQIDKALKQKRDIAAAAGLVYDEGDLHREMHSAVWGAENRFATLRAAQRRHEQLHIGSSLDTPEERDDRVNAIGNLRVNHADYVERNGLDLQALQAELEVALRRWLDPLWAEVKHSAETFKALFPFIIGEWSSRGHYRKTPGRNAYTGIGILIEVTDWNDAVAIHVRNPSLSSFADLPERQPSDVLWLAAAAINTKSLTEAKIVLAYCKHDQAFERKVGHLQQDLAVMADALLREKKQ